MNDRNDGEAFTAKPLTGPFAHRPIAVNYFTWGARLPDGSIKNFLTQDYGTEEDAYWAAMDFMVAEAAKQQPATPSIASIAAAFDRIFGEAV